jgi:hypothetical protein
VTQKQATEYVTFYLEGEDLSHFATIGKLDVAGMRGVFTTERRKEASVKVQAKRLGVMVRGIDPRGHDAARRSYLSGRRASSPLSDPMAEHAERAATITARDRSAAVKALRSTWARRLKAEQEVEDAKAEESHCVRELIVILGPGPYEIDGRFYKVGYNRMNRFYLIEDRKAVKL